MYTFVNVSLYEPIETISMNIQIYYFFSDINQDFLKSEWNENII